MAETNVVPVKRGDGKPRRAAPSSLLEVRVLEPAEARAETKAIPVK